MIVIFNSRVITWKKCGGQLITQCNCLVKKRCSLGSGFLGIEQAPLLISNGTTMNFVVPASAQVVIVSL